jgi:hypothetical protein
MLIEAFPRNSDVLKVHILNRLSSEQELSNDIATGKREITESVDIDSFSSGLKSDILDALGFLGDELADSILDQCIAHVIFETFSV